MEIIDHLYYGFGKIILAAITVDGNVSQTEIKSVKKHIEKERNNPNIDLTLIEIGLKQFQKRQTGTSLELLNRGLHEFHLGDAHLTPEMASVFRSIMIDVASAEYPITKEEANLVDKFIAYLNEREKAANS